MAPESISRVGSTPSFRSALKIGAERNEERSEIDANQQKFLEAQEKAAEDFKRKQEQKQREKEQKQELDMLQRQLEASKKEAEAMEDEFETFSKCMKIASRIAKGDIVPAKDLKYLAEHEPDLYKQAILLRVPNPKPKKHKSVVGDEDEQTEETGGAEESSGSGDEAVTEAAAAGSGEASEGE